MKHGGEVEPCRCARSGLLVIRLEQVDPDNVADVVGPLRISRAAHGPLMAQNGRVAAQSQAVPEPREIDPTHADDGSCSAVGRESGAVSGAQPRVKSIRARAIGFEL